MLSDNEKMLSICILQYDNEDYVEELLNSLLISGKSIFTNKVEIVILNDNSPRTELLDKIIHNFISSHTDIDIKYRKNEKNLGQLEARREILKFANGQYVKYIDGDDLLCKNAIDNTIKLIESHDYPDILETNSYNIVKNNDNSEWVLTPVSNDYRQIYNGSLKDDDNLLFKYLSTPYLFFNIWTKCYKKDILLKAYDKIPKNTLCCLGEDLLTTFMVYSVAKTYYGDSSINTYIYRKNVGCSTLNGTRIDNKLLERNTNYITASLTYNYIKSLDNKYPKDQYDKLVENYRIKIFRHCMAFDYFTYMVYTVNTNTVYEDGLTPDKIKERFESLYGKSVWNRYIELKRNPKYMQWHIPYLVDWFGEKELNSDNELLKFG